MYIKCLQLLNVSIDLLNNIYRKEFCLILYSQNSLWKPLTMIYRIGRDLVYGDIDKEQVVQEIKRFDNVYALIPPQTELLLATAGLGANLATGVL